MLAFVFAILSFWAVFQFFFLNNYFNGQAQHPLADPSSFGALISLALFCSIGWVLVAKDVKQKRAATGLSIALLCGLISTVARGPVLALFVTLPMFLWLLWPQIKASRKYLMIISMCGLLFFGLTTLGIQKKLDLGERFFGMVTQGDPADNSRLEIWSSTLDIIKDHPWTGTGIGTFFLYYPEYRLNTSFVNIYLTHNDPLQFFAEMGILSPLLFYAFVLLATMRTFKSLKALKDESQTQDRVLIVTLFCALCALVLGSHVGFNHYNLSILMLEGVMLALWYQTTSRVLKTPVMVSDMPKSVPMVLNKSLLFAPFGVIVFFVISFSMGEHFANKASRNLFQENMFEFAQNVNNAGRVTNDQNFRVYLLAVNVPLAILDFKKDKIENDEAEKLYAQVTGYMTRVMEINPRSASAPYYLGKVQMMVPDGVVPKDTPSPEFYFKEALRLDKTHLGARLSLLKLYADAGMPLKDQIAMMEEGIHFTYLMPIARDYYGELSRLYLEIGDYEKSKEMLQKMVDFQRWMEFSRVRQNTSIPQAVMGGDEALSKIW